MSNLPKRHYETLAAWRYALRQFLLFSQEAARTVGIPPQQHQALLVIKGTPGRDYVTVGEIAQRMHLKPNSAVGLIDRLTKRHLVQRLASSSDRRKIEVRLTSRGEALVERLSSVHLRELRELRPELEQLLRIVDGA